MLWRGGITGVFILEWGQKMSKSLPFLLILIISFTTIHAGETKDAPLLIKGTIKVTAEGLLETAEKISDLLIIDSRIHSDRRQGYIEDSISLPDIETNCKSLSKVIPRKTTPVLFYCNGVKCGRSVVSSRVALKCGYKNIYWFRGGYEEWKAKGFPSVK